MSVLSDCLLRTSTRLSSILPAGMLTDAGRLLAATTLAAAAAFPVVAHAQSDQPVISKNAAGRLGDSLGGIFGRVVSAVVIGEGGNSQAGRSVAILGRQVIEDVSRDQGRRVAEKPYQKGVKSQADLQVMSDRLDVAALNAILAVDERRGFGTGYTFARPGAEQATQKMNAAIDVFDSLMIAALNADFDVTAWRPVQSVLRGRPEAKPASDLAADASAPLARLQRSGGPGYQPDNSPRVTMNDIRDSIEAGSPTYQNRSAP